MLRLCGGVVQNCSVYNARIFTGWQAYGALPNPPLLYSDGGGVQLLLCGGVLTVDGLGFDAEETRSFIELCGCKTLICSGEALAKLGICGKTERYTVMRYASEAPAACGEVCTQPRLDDVYPLLKAEFTNMASLGFNDWYCDVSLKIRRGLGFMYAVYEGGTLCACAGVNYRNDNTAVIGSVVTAPAHRGRGLAATLVNAATARVLAAGLIPQIVCQNEAAMRLYKKIGYVPTEEYTETRR